MKEQNFKRGLVIGKFMPIHNGHLALINFAISQCDEVIVSMSYTPNDVIDPQLRFEWINEIFKDEPKVKPAIIVDDFDQEALPLPERTKRWAKKMTEVYPPFDLLFSSEEYGDHFAKNLNAEHKVFDLKRESIPISATLIRHKPFTYWDFIPAVVQPYFVKKICFYGPESTGKSTLSQQMATLYQTVFVPEVAREMIVDNNLTVDDFIRIGVAQNQRIIDLAKVANKILFCDTDLITTQIYAKHYLNTVPSELLDLEKQAVYDQYFLLDIDVDWVADHLRDLGDRRVEMYNIFKQELDRRNINYIKVEGNYEERGKLIKAVIDRLIH